jgi:hypothetical protein
LIATALVVAVIFSFLPTPIRADIGNEFSWHSMFTSYWENLWDIWGASPSDIFAVGDNIIIHYNGTNWTTMVNNSNYNLKAVWGSSSSNVFAVGAQGLILHYDGSSWQSMNSQVVNNLFDVWGTSASDVFRTVDRDKWISSHSASFSV